MIEVGGLNSDLQVDQTSEDLGKKVLYIEDTKSDHLKSGKISKLDFWKVGFQTVEI